MSVPFIKFVYWNENEWMSNFFQLTLNNCPVHHVADSNKAAAPAFSFAGRHEVKVGTEIDGSDICLPQVESAAPAPNIYNTSGLTAKGIINITAPRVQPE